MEVKTKTMGTVSVEDSRILDFPNGLFGFEDYHRYALINSEYEPFMYLQSLDVSTLSFLLVDPFIIASDYELDIDDKTLSEIGITSPADVVVFAVVTVPVAAGSVTANLQGPLVINRKNNKAMQAILSNSKWTTKHNIIKAIENRGKK
jgi:flagellar assembly factor FliW